MRMQIQADVPANSPREGVALQHWRVQPFQRVDLQLPATLAHVLQGAGRAALSNHRHAWLHVHR